MTAESSSYRSTMTAESDIARGSFAILFGPFEIFIFENGPPRARVRSEDASFSFSLLPPPPPLPPPPFLRRRGSRRMNSTGSVDAPQCHLSDRDDAKNDGSKELAGSRGGRASDAEDGSDVASTAKEEEEDGRVSSCLQLLSDDVLIQIFAYCGPTDVEGSAKRTNRRFRDVTSRSMTLWKEFCVLTGKALDAGFAAGDGELDGFDALSSPGLASNDDDEEELRDANPYRSYYFRNPCVPVDFASIQEALDRCPRTPRASMRWLGAGDEGRYRYSDVGTVVLMPGIYDERVSIGGEPWTVGRAFDKAVAIRASFPEVGATIRGRRASREAASGGGGGGGADDGRDRPCVAISTCDEEAFEGVQKGISVTMSHLRILHSSPGADIWGGNTAVIVDGPRAQVNIDSCILQSDSGRGLVVTNQAVAEVYRSSIVDCAATGFYLGDWGSRARISACNIVRNGFGSKHLRSPSADNHGAGNIRDVLERGIPQFQAVPPGHSGVYIESSMCWIEDSLLAGNCLTGLSVVRGGFVSLSGSDITENGHSSPILIEDAHDVRDATRLQGISIRGGVVEGPAKNNYTSRRENDGDKRVFKGGFVREGAPFDGEVVCGTEEQSW
ncbi:hypothetical protein ACHAWF_015907 [Thalassiosira exigua]